MSYQEIHCETLTIFQLQSGETSSYPLESLGLLKHIRGQGYSETIKLTETVLHEDDALAVAAGENNIVTF